LSNLKSGLGQGVQRFRDSGFGASPFGLRPHMQGSAFRRSWFSRNRHKRHKRV